MSTEINLSMATRVALLLCSRLGMRTGTVTQLTDAQFGAFESAMCELACTDADWMSPKGICEEQVGTLCAKANRLKGARVRPLEVDAVLALLRREAELAASLEKWGRVGIRVIGRQDAQYPARLRTQLKPIEVPPLLYYAGKAELFAGGGLAMVGSRDIREDASKAVQLVAGQCADAGMNVVSGGARGADSLAMEAASAAGGCVIGALSGDLLRVCSAAKTHDALQSGRTLLFSHAEPEDGFSTIHAMSRNRYIYALADAAFVAQSDTKGGTWAGATEELKRPNGRPVFVYCGSPIAAGNQKLLTLGAIAWNMEAPLASNLQNAKPHRPSAAQTEFEF